MRSGIQCAFLVAAATLVAGAQMHKVAKKENVTRAVAVYEWTGDLHKPAASRLIPISLFYNDEFQDAGLYMARPVPLALYAETVYELQDAGQPKGLFDLEFARNLKPSDANSTAWDDGWTGYGRWQPIPVEKPKKTEKVTLDADKDKDSSRPTLGRKTGNSKDKKSKDKSQDHGSVTPVGDDPQDDSDRPTLKKRTAQEKKAAIKNDTGSVSTVGDLNDDPDRPKIVRGKPTTGLEVEIPRLVGLPKTDMQQMIAVSDATTRDPHDFSYHWRDPAEQTEIQAKLEKVAEGLVAPAPSAPAAPKPGPSRTGAQSKLRKGVVQPTKPAVPFKLEDEKLSAYELSYNSSPVFVLEGHTSGTDTSVQYVTVVAQNDTFGQPQVAIKTKTDVAHMDETPQMRLVGAVDADASNRASLLMELRGQQSRSFALYRVISAQATQLFVTGATQ